MGLFCCSRRLHSPFDGRGFILKGFVTKQAINTLFTTLFYYNHGTIKNLTIKDFIIGGDFSDIRYHGLLVYFNNSNATNFGLIENCQSYGNLTAESLNSLYLGVFAYHSHGNSTITNCTNNMNINLSGEGSAHIGGIATNAYLTSTLSNNINNGNIYVIARAGGIVSYTNDTTSGTIQGNTNYGSITTTRNTGAIYAGGIVGFLQISAKPTIVDNINYGDITSYSTTYPTCGIASGPGQNTVFTHSGGSAIQSFNL